MKKLTMCMVMSMMVLVGCTSPGNSASKVREMGKESFWQGLTYDTEQDNMILFSDLEEAFKINNIPLIKETYPDALSGQYNFNDDRISITVLVDEFIWPGHELVSGVFIEPRNNYMLLSEHPSVESVARVMGKEGLLTWLADREGEMTQAGKSNQNINDLLAIDRCYLYFDYQSASDTRRLAFKWMPKPHIAKAFEEIAPRLEENGMLTTGYIEGPGGETLIMANSPYYLLTKMGYFSSDNKVVVEKAAAYQIMHNTKKPDTYSVQLSGYMRGDLAYPTQIEAMPGLEEISQRMNMGQKEFMAITGEINKELTEAKRVRNNIYSGDYYKEGEVGEYRYVITVPQGMAVYNFTVLMEKI